MTDPRYEPAAGPESGTAAGAPGEAPAQVDRWCEWSRLPELDRLLQDAGLPTGADRWQNAQDLLAALAAAHRLPADPHRVRPLLAPLFCRSPAEQRRFAEVFEHWLDQDAPRASGAASVPVGDLSTPRKPPPQTPLRPVLLGLGLAIVLLALGLYLGLPPTPVAPGPTQSGPTPRPFDPPPFAGSSDYLKLPLDPIPPRTPSEVLGPGPQAQRWLAVVDWLLPALPGPILFAGLAWRWLRRRDVLRYRRGDADAPLRHITLAGADDDLFTDPVLQAALRRLHTPVRVPTGRLDERATVERSARRLGLFSPAYRALPRVPDLVVLVDFQHRDDHLAGLAETFVERLRGAGLQVHRYPFQRHPTRVLGPRGQGIGLSELAARHAGARLLIVGDPAVFFHPWSGRVADWTEVLALWPRRALLATRAVPEAWRAALAGSGLALAPFGEAGLIRLAADLSRAPTVPSTLPEPTLPGCLAGPAGAWEAAPEAEDRRALLRDLDAWLGPRGGLLLAAVAVYPQLHPGLTRVLDQALFPDDPPASRAPRLLRLARLPWLRAGHLPDGLRRALADRTGRAEARRIGAIYRELLARASVEGEEAVRLPLAVPAARRSWPALRERGGRLGRWIADLVRVAGPDAALRDRIFLDAVLRPRLLDFLLPRRLARRLPRRPGGAAGRLAALALTLALGAALHLAWQGGRLGHPGLRDWAAETARAVESSAHRGIQVEILHTPASARLAERLSQVLASSGFPASHLALIPERAAATEPAAGARPAPRPVNTVQLGDPSAEGPGTFIADRLQYLAWGDRPLLADRLAEPPAGADAALAGTPPLAGRVRVWLTTAGHGGIFSEALGHPFSDAERARFRDPKGLSPPEPAQPRPRVFRDRLKDGSPGPALVALPGGSFRMGSPPDEPQRYPDEGPQHPVTLRPFAIGRTEVTFAEYDRFATATGRKQPNDGGWGRGDRPVIHVSWQDATAYAVWLAGETGLPYRLPTEAEWEYAARAGTETPFWTGDCLHTDQANYDGKVDYNGCGAKTGLYRARTVPAGTLPANPWGLYEVAGNVWEWVADCWHGSYQGAPLDGSAWGEAGGGDCARRVGRGGGWFNKPRWLRSANRFGDSADDASDFLGFRLARTL